MLPTPSASLYAEILAASQAGGGIVELPARLTLDMPITLQANVWLRGRGPSTVVTLADGFAFPFAFASTEGAGVISVSDFTFDGNAGNIPADAGLGVLLHHVEPGSFVDRVTFRHTMRAAVNLGSVWGRAIGARVTNCTFVKCGQLHSAMEFCGLGITNAVDVIASGNVFQDCGQAVDLEMHPHVADCLINISVYGNVIRSTIGYPSCWGIAVIGQAARPAQHIHIHGNTFYGGPGLGPALYQEHVEHYREENNSVWQL